MEGRIVKNISNDYTVSQNGEKFVCKPRGKFRSENISPLVGDIVEFDENTHYILNISPRKNSLVRPPVANVDQAVIVMSIAEPDFSANLLDKLLAIIQFHGIKPIICFTKLDLLSENEKVEKLNFIEYYKNIGYSVYINQNIEELKTIFAGKVTVFTGQSGAGKSTLLNRLDEQLDLKTDEISKALGRGKHTTRHVELLEIENGLIADTPGFSNVDFTDMKSIDIRNGFLEFQDYQNGCKYQDCMHDKEDVCGVKPEVGKTILASRYENYLKFIRKEK